MQPATAAAFWGINDMTNTTSNRVRPGSLWLVLALAVCLTACGDKDEAPPRAPASQPAATTPAAPVASEAEVVIDTTEEEAMVIQPSLVDTLSVDELLVRADAAEKDKQLFVPAGESAFEMYLRVTEQEPDQVRARNALSDLYPYAMLYVEQRTTAGDLEESERVLDLMRRADENAPALPRLDRGVDQLRDRIAGEAQRAASAAAASAAAAAAAAAAPVPVREPTAITPEIEPVASAPLPQDASASRPAPAPVVEPAPVVAAPTPAPTPPPPAATPAPVMPTVVSSVQPRFPPLAMRRRIEGSVDVGFTIMPDGSVTNVRVLSSRPNNTFDREAVNAMERWRFTATGRQVESHRIFDFKMTD